MRRRFFIGVLVAVAGVGLVSLAAITQARVGHRITRAPARQLRHQHEAATASANLPSRASSQDANDAATAHLETHNQIDDAAISNILEIRRHHGAGLLNETLLDSVLAADSISTDVGVLEIPADDFSAALRRVASNASNDASLSAAARLEACQEQYERALRFGDDAEFILAMRTASRHLDYRADDLEEDQQFRHADRLRRLADRLRKEARAVDNVLSADASQR